MGVVLSLFARGMVSHADLTVGGDVEYVDTPAAIDSILADYAVGKRPHAVFVKRHAGAISAVWATFFANPAADRAPYVRLAKRRMCAQARDKRRTA